MTVYVSLPQVPLTLKFEEPFEEVAAHLQDLVDAGSVHRYDWDDGQAVLVNYGVISTVTLSERHRALEISELHRGLSASIPGTGG